MKKALQLSILTILVLVAITFFESKSFLKEPIYGLAVMGFLILAAGIISLETGISTSILELMMGGIAALTPLSVLASEDVLSVLSEFGSLVLMFVAGTEVETHILKNKFKESAALGLLSFLLPFVATLALLFLLFNTSGSKAFLIATSMSTTSVAIMYVALKDLGMLNTKLGQTMFVGAMVADILSMITLSIILGQFSVFSVAYPALILFVLLVLPSILREFIKLEAPWSLELKFVLLVLLVLALLSEELGIHSAITSFIIGLAFGEIVKSHKILEEKIKGVGFSFFIPIFFFRAGLLIDYHGLLEVLPLFLAMSVTAIVAKYIGAYLPLRRIFKLKDKKLPFLFNARLAIGTIAATYGLKYGLIGIQEYSVILTLVLISSIPIAVVLREVSSSTIKRSF